MLSNDGTITFNDAGTYLVRLVVQYGRTGSSSSANLHARAVVNGTTQIGDTVSASIESASTLIPIAISAWATVLAGTTFHYELIRDSSGTDAGGVFSSPATLAGWADSPSASVRVERIVAA